MYEMNNYDIAVVVNSLANAIASEAANPDFWRTVEGTIVQYQYNRIEIDLEQLAMSMLSITDPISQIVHTIEQIINAIFESLKNAIASAVNAIAEGVVKPALEAIKSAVSALTQTVSRLPQTVSQIAGAIEQLLRSIPKIVNSIADRISKAVSSAIQSVGEMMRKAIDDVNQTLQNLPNVIKGALVRALEAYVQAIRTISDFLRDALPKLSEAIKRTGESIISAINSIVKDLRESVQQIANAIKGPFERLIEAISGALAPAVKAIYDFLSNSVVPILNQIWKAITQAVAKFDQGIEYLGKQVEAVMDIVSNMPKIVSEAIKSISSTISGTLSKLSAAISSALKTVQDAIIGAIKSIQSAIAQLPNTISTVVSSAANAIRSTISSVLNAISALGSSIYNALSSAVNTIVNAISRVTSTISFFITNAVSTITGAISSAINTISNVISNVISPISNSISYIRSVIENIPSTIYQLIKPALDAIGSAVGQVANVLSEVASTVSRIFSTITSLPITIKNFISNAIGEISKAISKLPETIANAIKDIIDKVVGIINDLRSRIINFFQSVEEKIQLLLRSTGEVKNEVSKVKQEVPEEVVKRLTPKVENVNKELLQLRSDLAQAIKPGGVCSVDMEKAEELLEEALKKQMEVELEKFDKLLEKRLKGAMKTELGPVTKGMTTVQQVLTQAQNTLQQHTGILTNIAGWIQNATNALTGFVNAVSSMASSIIDTLNNLFANVPDLVKMLIDILNDPTNIMKVTLNAVTNVIDAVVALLGQLLNTVGTIFDNIINNTVKAINNMANKVATDVIGSIVNAIETVKNVTLNAVKGVTLTSSVIVGDLVSSVNNLRHAITSMTPGAVWAMPAIIPFTLFDNTILNYAIGIGIAAAIVAAIAKMVDYEVSLEPLGIGVKINVKDVLSTVARSIGNLAKTFTRDLVNAFSFGIAYNMFRPLDYAFRALFVNYFDGLVTSMYANVIPDEWKANAMLNAFSEPPSLTMIRDMARRLMSLDLVSMDPRRALNMLLSGNYTTNIRRVINTIRTHFVLRGLPKWYINLYTATNLAVKWVDRFGNEAYFLLGELFEIPTHSELARMTIKDIIPNINMMYNLGWLRGWPPDVTKSIYLMHFKYPSFEKLLKFYYRAISGMLWYSPPHEIRALFSTEAKALGTDPPISPYEIALKLGDPRAVAALETALGAYFKWLEYSNFPWISRNTVVNGVPIGNIVYSVLNGWTADSWLLADIAADIPSKIDQRWMSRFGLFLLMTEKGWNPLTNVPLVDVLPMLMEKAPQSAITLDLRAHSKLLQATGLHPAWVPITTVAENIMVISDEMTLMRTGWLNLFKYGMLTSDQVEHYLSGLLKVSYRTMYFDPVSKQWKDAWITVPIRWLPHERKLLQIRFVIDRVINMFRELYSYLRSAVRNLALPVEGTFTISTTIDDERIQFSYKGMKEILQEFVNMMNEYFASEMERITGTRMEIGIDDRFINMWIEMERTAKQIETLVKARYLWYRLSGYLLYRLAYGFTKYEDVKKLIDDVAKILPLTEEEKALYLIVFKNVTGIMKREYVPTPSQLATIAEDVPTVLKDFEDAFLQTGEIPKDSFIAKVFEQRNVPTEWWPVWARYVIVHARRDEIRRIVTELINLYAHKLITDDEVNALYNNVLSKYGVDEKEIELLKLSADLRMRYVWEWQRYVGGTPTPNELARLNELLGSALELVVTPTFPTLSNKNYKLIDLAYEVRGVPEEWRPIWKAYAKVNNVIDEVRRAITRVITAYARGAIKDKDEFMRVLDMIEQSAYNVLPDELKAKLRPTKWLLSEEERELLFVSAELARNYSEMRNILPTPMQLASIADVVFEVTEKLDDLWKYHFYPEPYSTILKQYVLRRRFADEKRLLERGIARALAIGITWDEIMQILNDTAKEFGFNNVDDLLKYIGLDMKEIELARARYLVDHMYEDVREVERAWRPTPLTIANMLEVVKIPDSVISSYNIPNTFKTYVLEYVKKKPYVNDFNRVVNDYYNVMTYAYQYNNSIASALSDIANSIDALFDEFNFDSKERQMHELSARLRAIYNRARRGYTVAIPTLHELANIVEVIPEAANMTSTLIEHYFVPQQWASIWSKYISVKPVADEVRRLLSEAIRAYAYGAIGEAELNEVFNFAKNYGWTDKEIQVLKRMAELYAKRIAVREIGREYIPTPSQMATIVEYVPSAKALLDSVFEARNVPDEWREVWRQYVNARPVADELRRLLATAITAYARHIINDSELNEIFNLAKKYGWSDDEIQVLKEVATLRRMYVEGVEEAREYIPTPYQLGVIAEYVPAARKMIDEVLEKRNVPDEWKEIWKAFVTIRPIYDEVRRIVTELINMYARFEITKDALSQLLNVLQNYGLDKLEALMIAKLAELRAADYAWRELVGTPRSLVTMAEYSPTARNLALSYVYRMIDALPVDDNTKKLIKTMWEEYVRVKPVYDEVRKYVNELVNDYARGAIGRTTLEQELNELKEWGLDDYEIQFYLWLAEKRRQRYLIEQMYGG